MKEKKKKGLPFSKKTIATLTISTMTKILGGNSDLDPTGHSINLEK